MADGARLRRTRPGRRRGRSLAVLLLAFLLAASLPVGVSAAHFWTIGASASSVVQHVSTGVTLTIQNTSTNNGGGDSIGCVIVTIPAAYDVDSVSIDFVSRGFTWSASTSGTTTKQVRLVASSDGNRLRGDDDFDILQATITVTGNTVGTANWSATEYEKPNCSDEQLTAVLPMSISAGVNAAPSATVDAYGAVAGTTLTVSAAGVLGNDTDPDGDPIVAVLVGNVASGSLALASDGSFTYTPNAGFTGSDGFTYQASDGSLSSATTAVTLTVTNVAPTTTADGYAASKNVLLSVSAASGVLSNDTDPDSASGQGLTAVLGTGPAAGTLNLAANGSFTYDPPTGATGPYTFTYRVFDGVVTSALETVTITVSNDAPVAGDDGYSTHMGIPVIAPPATLLTDDDTDINGDTLTVALVTPPSNGGLLIGTDGSFTYTPTLLWVGTDTFTYRVNDGTTWSAPATVTIGVSNGQPTALDDAASGSHDAPISGDVLANDLDPDGDPLTAVLVTDVASGGLALASDGTWTYTPAAGFVGPDSFAYRASDGASVSTVATVSIDVTNAAPVAVDDTDTIGHGRTLTRAAPGVVANDTDADGDALTTTLVSDVANGTLTLAADGGYAYTPTPGFTGFDSFTYTATDGLATSAAATVTIEVTDAPPVAVDDAWIVLHDRDLVVAAPGVLALDSDPDGDALTASLDSGPSVGTLVGGVAANGGFTYRPAPGFVGADTFTYRISDGVQTATASVTITVINTPPVAFPDGASVRHDRTLVVAAPGVLGNDVDANGDTLTASIVTGAAHGTVSLSANGRWSYSPVPGYVGLDGFSYAASDGAASATGTVVITVSNVAPVAVADAYTLSQDTPTTIAAGSGVLANDIDADGDTLNADLVSGPTNGTLVLSASGRFTYTPDDGFVGADTFTYHASDGIASSPIAVVALTVTARSPAPTALPTPEPIPDPTPEPTPEATPDPTPEPTASATPTPTTSPASGPPSSGGEPPADTWSIGPRDATGNGASGADMPIANLASSTLGLFGQVFDWLVPGAALSVPGLLLFLAILAQMSGALAWLPLVRRKIGGFGFSDAPAASGGARR